MDSQAIRPSRWLTFVTGWRTPSAALHALTESRGPYRWWGVMFGRFFVGIMRSETSDADHVRAKIDAGLASVARGEVYTTDEVRAHLAARREERSREQS